jgi:hypothetical protein
MEGRRSEDPDDPRFIAERKAAEEIVLRCIEGNALNGVARRNREVSAFVKGMQVRQKVLFLCKKIFFEIRCTKVCRGG